MEKVFNYQLVLNFDKGKTRVIFTGETTFMAPESIIDSSLCFLHNEIVDELHANAGCFVESFMFNEKNLDPNGTQTSNT